VFSEEGCMNRRGISLLGKRDRARDEHSLAQFRAISRANQKTSARHGRERHRDLKLRIVAPAGALVSLGPAVVEDVLALAVTLQVAGRDARDHTTLFQCEMTG